MSKLSIVFCILLLTISCTSKQVTNGKYYFDESGSSLKQLDLKYEILKQFYGNHTPEKILVRYMEMKSSRFNTKDNSVMIGGKHLDSVVIHESSHLAMNNLTSGASLLEEFHGFDEGMACVMENRAADRIDLLKQKSINIAFREFKKNNLSFSKIQIWSKYYGEWQGKQDDFKRNSYAYPVVTSFIYFLWDRYGEQKVREFFISLGNTRSLKKTIKQIFSMNQDTLEEKWKEYLRDKNNLKECSPQIIKMFPENNSSDVDSNVKEIYVVFNQDMDKKIILRTNCEDDFCYKNAFWKDSKTLAITLNKGLQKRKQYVGYLGSKGHGLLLSEEGCELSETTWSFKTR